MEKKNYIIQTSVGNSFQIIAKKAQDKARELKDTNVEFDFNGVTCIVSISTQLDNLWRDYCNAHMMDWKVVGPDCEYSYSSEILYELARKTKEQEEKQVEQQKKWDEEEKIKKEKLGKLTSELQIELKDEKLWNEQVALNKDGGYGEAIMKYAENWALLMQKEIAAGKKVKDIAEKTSRDADTEGITGFMYGAAVQELSACWKYGEELRKCHNKEYGHEGEGVVNPAVLTISKK